MLVPNNESCWCMETYGFLVKKSYPQYTKQYILQSKPFNSKRQGIVEFLEKNYNTKDVGFEKYVASNF